MEIYNGEVKKITEETIKIENIQLKVYRFESKENLSGFIIPKQKKLEKLFNALDKIPRTSREQENDVTVFNSIATHLPKLGEKFSMMGFYYYKGNIVVQDTFCEEIEAGFPDTDSRLKTLIKAVKSGSF